MKEKIIGIYCIENIVNGKKYIGRTNDLNRRFRAHVRLLKNNKHDNEHLQLAWNKYGEGNFKFYLLQECPEEQLNVLEFELIEEFNTINRSIGYNKTKGGDGILGFRHSEKTKIQLSEISSKQIHSKETRLKIGKGNKGKHVTKETCEKLSLSIRNVSRKNEKSSSQHIGIYFRKEKILNPWTAKITISLCNRINLGSFHTEQEAIIAWENKYLEIYGKPYTNNESEG